MNIKIKDTQFCFQHSKVLRKSCANNKDVKIYDYIPSVRHFDAVLICRTFHSGSYNANIKGDSKRSYDNDITARNFQSQIVGLHSLSVVRTTRSDCSSPFDLQPPVLGVMLSSWVLLRRSQLLWSSKRYIRGKMFGCRLFLEIVSFESNSN